VDNESWGPDRGVNLRCRNHGQLGVRRAKPACCRGCKNPTGGAILRSDARARNDQEVVGRGDRFLPTVPSPFALLSRSSPERRSDPPPGRGSDSPAAAFEQHARTVRHGHSCIARAKLPTAGFLVTDGRRMGGRADQSSLRLLRSDRSRFLAGSWRGNYSTARTFDSAFGLRFRGHYFAPERERPLPAASPRNPVGFRYGPWTADCCFWRRELRARVTAYSPKKRPAF
jgi:hypothetical protein